MSVRWAWVFLDLPEDGFETSLAFWQAVTRTELSPRRGLAGEFVTLLPAQGDPWVKVQRVRGAGGVHVDLDVDEPLEQARERATSLGAVVLHEWHLDDQLEVVVCRSPGGFVFCLTQWSEAGPSPAGAVRAGLDSVLDQVCLDIPPSRYDVEVAFWSALTGWDVEHDVSREFERLEWPREQLPVRFLLQRLDDEGDGVVRGHVDLACVDREAEAARHVSLGATRVGPGDGWVVMRSPAGHLYCCTARHPLTGGAAPG
jgi:hypothetical protein